VPPGDAAALADRIGLLLADRDSRQRMGEAGRQRLRERFRLPETARRIETIYTAVLS
jgi:glycosyltransferase involved in cell wall biosynthesis